VLSGTVAQRPTAQPPGLYRYGAAGWEWLPGSDAASQVRGRGAPSYVLYDGPNPGLPRAAARVLRRADLGRAPVPVETFILNPEDYSRYRVGGDGVWGIRDSHLRAPALARVQGYASLDLTYQATADPRFQDLILPGPDWLVLDLAPDGRHYLLADLSQATGETPTTLLYYAGGASRPQALYAVAGMVLRGQFSPDGRWVLITSTESRANRIDSVQYVRLLDRTRLAGQAVLDPAAVQMLLRQAVGAAQAPGIGATFLTDGPRTGQIVIVAQTAEGSQVSLYDPATPNIPPRVLWTEPVPPSAPLWVRAGGADGGLVFGWQDAAYFGRDAYVYVTGENRTVTLRPQLPGQTLGTAWLVGDTLIYETSGWPGVGGEEFRSVYSLPLRGLAGEPPLPRHFGSALPGGGPIPEGRPIYTGGLMTLLRYGAGEPVALGSPWLGTIPGGTLHLRSVDGTQGVSLADGVVGLYPVAAPFTVESVGLLR
jgi:hypothetical protein